MDREGLTRQSPESPIASFDIAEQPPFRLFAAFYVFAVVIGVFLVHRGLTANDTNDRVLAGPESAPFEVTYPEGWTPLEGAALNAESSSGLAALRRDDGSGVIVISRRGPVTTDHEKLARRLRSEFAELVPDFQERQVGTVQTRAGEAFLYSYIRREVGSVHSQIIVPIDSGSYLINTVTQPDAEVTGREIGEIVVSFDAP